MFYLLLLNPELRILSLKVEEVIGVVYPNFSITYSWRYCYVKVDVGGHTNVEIGMQSGILFIVRKSWFNISVKFNLF